jgi:hypothetical protein
MKDGSAMVVMAREYGTDTTVVKKVSRHLFHDFQLPIHESTPCLHQVPIEGSAKLRLELSPDRKQVCGVPVLAGKDWQTY